MPNSANFWKRLTKCRPWPSFPASLNSSQICSVDFRVGYISHFISFVVIEPQNSTSNVHFNIAVCNTSLNFVFFKFCKHRNYSNLLSPNFRFQYWKKKIVELVINLKQFYRHNRKSQIIRVTDMILQYCNVHNEVKGCALFSKVYLPPRELSRVVMITHVVYRQPFQKGWFYFP